MRKPEQRLWDRFSAAARRERLYCERVENLVARGTPDVYGVGWWMELKAAPRPPARASTRLLGDKGLNRDQVNWHIAHAAAGGVSFVLIGVGSSLNLLLPGARAPHINNAPLAELESWAAAAASPRAAGGWSVIIDAINKERLS